jgi:hypothetical protein
LFRRPDDFVLLDLKAHGQRVGDDFFRQIFAVKSASDLGTFFSDFALLFRRERMHPGKQQRTNGI